MQTRKRIKPKHENSIENLKDKDRENAHQDLYWFCASFFLDT